MSDCIFCEIVSGELPSNTVYKDGLVTAFRDINPQAPVHILIVPNLHINGTSDVDSTHAAALAAMFTTASQLARSEGLTRGFRLVINEGADAGQSVFHLHMHLLGGRQMAWPPG